MPPLSTNNMRSLIKAIVFASTAALCLQCQTNDYVYGAYYIYRNESSRTVTVESFSPIKRNGMLVPGRDSTFVLPIGGEHTLLYSAEGGYVNPLCLYNNPWGYDSTIISNGIRQVVQRQWERDPLYFQENYEVVSEGRLTKTFRFVFTDDFFENGEPITDRNLPQP